MKITLTEIHLDRALAQPWDTRTCLMSQAITEAVAKPVACSRGSVACENGKEYKFDGEVVRLMTMFDTGHNSKPPDKSILDTLRLSLPLTFDLIETTPSDL